MKKIMIMGLTLILVPMLFGDDAVPRIINGTQKRVEPSIKHIKAIETPVSYRPGGRQQVLFVEDPAGLGPPSPDQYWQAALDSILGVGNYGWFGPTTSYPENGPDLATMQIYALVIWNTYDCWNPGAGPALTATDQTNIANYISGGGKVWLIGQDILFSGVPYAWMTTNFNMQSAIEDYSGVSGLDPYPITGLAEIAGLSFSFLVDWGSDVFPDGLTPTVDAHHVIQDVNYPTYYPSILSNNYQTSFWTVDGRNPNPWADWEQMAHDMLDAFGVLGVSYVWDFEGGVLDPWTTSGYNWGIRDTMDTYGPDTCAVLGYQYAGVPDTDIPEYAGNQTGRLISPTIDITGWGALYFSFNYWSSFEGPATNFDGGIIEISPDNGVTWIQVDSLAEGHLNPTYDSELAGSGPLGYAWAYCYSTDPDWVNVSTQDLIALGYVSPGNQIQIRFHFASDPMSAGQGWFVDDIRIGDTEPPDLQPPIIVHTPLPDTTDTLSDYTISATVTDEGAGVNTDSVYLHYQIETGPLIDVQMTDMGSDVYEADIPAQVYHTDIFYHITAADLAGNEAFTPVYNFEVTNARTIIYDDGQPYWVSAATNPGDGSFVQFLFSDVGIDSGLLHQVKFYFSDPGTFDVRIYDGTTGNPGAFIDSMAGLYCSGIQWYTVDITDLDIQTANPNGVVVGHVIGPADSIGVLRDPALDYPNRMWNYIGNNWLSGISGDHMIRLKVIPITFTGVSETPTDASVFALGQIAPNPMRKNAMIEYQLAAAEMVCLKIYNVLGQLVTTLVNRYEQAGTHQVSWNSRDARGNRVASGVYFLKFDAGDYSATQKLLLLK
ncbi:T9SS type A sorting domain-containing protein [candidate division WOR-3 bacterium]|nr:T9SS type A sorting domain-containing protein [candidate division WOR-3 bacterium]